MDFRSDGFMYVVAVLIIGFVVAESLFFLIRATKQARKLGISKKTIIDTITQSALFSIGPAFSIALTVLVLSVSLGVVLPWIRLSVVGALQYEVPAAESAIAASGITTGLTQPISDPKVFSAVTWVMTLGSVFPLIFIPFSLKAIQKKVSGVANKNTAWTDVMSSAAFIGIIAAFIGRSLTGTGEAEVAGDGAGVLSMVALVSAIAFMLILAKISSLPKMQWLEPFAMPLSMFLSVLMVFLAIKLLPTAVSGFEWRT